MKEDIMEVDRSKEPYTCVSISTVQTLAQTIARLQEQLNEANDVIKKYANKENWSSIMDGCGYSENALYVDDCGYYSAEKYLEKWGVE